MRVSVFRKEHFNAAHRLNNLDWSAEKNQKIFGKCNSPNYHGHNYNLTVEVTGDIDPETGYVIDIKLLSDIIKDNILDKFDHKNLNLDTVEFAKVNPTAENIVVVIYKLLRDKIDTHLDLRITLYETERNYVQFPAK